MTTTTTTNNTATAIARAYRLASAHGHGWAISLPEAAWGALAEGAAARDIAEWLDAAGDAAAWGRHEDDEVAAAAAEERAEVASAAWRRASGEPEPDEHFGRPPRTAGECRHANAVAAATAALTGAIDGIDWSPDDDGVVRHRTCTRATSWDISHDGATVIRRHAPAAWGCIDHSRNLWGSVPGPVVASAVIAPDGSWRATVADGVTERDVLRLAECVSDALGGGDHVVARGVWLACDPRMVRAAAAAGSTAAAAALMPAVAPTARGSL